MTQRRFRLCGWTTFHCLRPRITRRGSQTYTAITWMFMVATYVFLQIYNRPCKYSITHTDTHRGCLPGRCCCCCWPLRPLTFDLTTVCGSWLAAGGHWAHLWLVHSGRGAGGNPRCKKAAHVVSRTLPALLHGNAGVVDGGGGHRFQTGDASLFSRRVTRCISLRIVDVIYFLFC